MLKDKSLREYHATEHILVRTAGALNRVSSKRRG